MKMPAILAGLYHKLHRCQKDEKDLFNLFYDAKVLSPTSVASSIVANSRELQETMHQIEVIQIALKQQENGILEEVEGVTELP